MVGKIFKIECKIKIASCGVDAIFIYCIDFIRINMYNIYEVIKNYADDVNGND